VEMALPLLVNFTQEFLQQKNILLNVNIKLSACGYYEEDNI
jgi:hypothetical protein